MWIVGLDLDGHRILCRDYVWAPIELLKWDPCPFSLLVMLTEAHMASGGLRLPKSSLEPTKTGFSVESCHIRPYIENMEELQKQEEFGL